MSPPQECGRQLPVWRCRPALQHSLILLILLLTGSPAFAADKLRIAVLKFGTASWEMAVIKRHGLDRKQGFELEVVELAGKQATMVALQAGDVDIALSDWIWVSRQRGEGKAFTFVPYSTAVGALVIPKGSDIRSLPDLKGKRLGIAGGPLDKSWLLLQALALRDYDMDLQSVLTPVFAAPPLLNQQLTQGRIDAVINFWPYVARLEAQGMQRLMGIQEVIRALGINSEVPIIGYIFDQRWAVQNRELLRGFIRATTQAKRIMNDSDREWLQLRPLMNAQDAASFEALRDDFRAGIPRHWGAREQQDAARLFALLANIGGRELVGNSSELNKGTFWPDVDY